MSDVLNPPVMNREDDKIFKIYKAVSSINKSINKFLDLSEQGNKIDNSKSSGSQNTAKLTNIEKQKQKDQQGFFKKLTGNFTEKTKELASNIKTNNSKPVESQDIAKLADMGKQEQKTNKKKQKDQQGFFKKLTEGFTEKTKELVGGIKTVGKSLGESAFSMMLGPLQLITKPFEELGNFKFFSILSNFFKRKKVSGKPTRAKMLKIDPGAVYISDQLKPKKKKKGILGNLFGKGGLFAGILAGMTPFKLLSLLGLAGIFVGLTLTDIFGKGGAIEYFKKGEIGKAIMTALFGKDNSGASGMGKALGIGKEALKWGALGAIIGTVVPGVGTVIGGLLGIGLGALGATIKLGIDSGFFANVMTQINKEGTVMNKVAKIITEAALFGALGAIVGVIALPGAGLFPGMFLGIGMGIALGGIQLGIDTGFFKKLWKGIKGGASKLGKWFVRAIWVPIKGFFVNIFNAVAGAISTGWQATMGFVSNIMVWARDSVVKPITAFFANIFSTIAGSISKAWTGTTVFIKNMASFVSKTIIKPVKNIFYRIKDKIDIFVKGSFNFVTDLFTNIKNAIFGFFDKIFGFIRFIGSNNIFQLMKMVAGGTFGSSLTSFNKGSEFKREALAGNTPAYSEILGLAKAMRKENHGLTITQAFTAALNEVVKKISDKVKPVTVTQVTQSDAMSSENIDKHLGRQ